jgi:hypothetical protein
LVVAFGAAGLVAGCSSGSSINYFSNGELYASHSFLVGYWNHVPVHAITQICDNLAHLQAPTPPAPQATAGDLDNWKNGCIVAAVNTAAKDYSGLHRTGSSSFTEP